MILKYRKATLNDIEEICGIVHNAIDNMERENIFQWDDLYPTKEDFQEDIDKSQLYVGMVNGQIAVVYTLNQECDKEYENGKWKYKDKPFYIIHRLCVNPTFQNRGIAKSTLLYIEKQLTEMGIYVIRLDVFSNNPFALRLYNSLGYSKVGYADWRKGRFFLMEKHLTSNSMEKTMKLKCAEEKDYTNIRDFYYSLIESMENAEFTPGWEKDIYPTQEFLITSIKNHELYFIENDIEIQACMIVNHLYNEGYNQVNWSVNATDNELLVIHALGVHPNYAGQGLAKKLVWNVIEMAKKQEFKTVRLDVLEGNIPAERAYCKIGFQYVATLKMFYEDTGWTNYKVYEYII